MAALCQGGQHGGLCVPVLHLGLRRLQIDPQPAVNDFTLHPSIHFQARRRRHDAGGLDHNSIAEIFRNGRHPRGASGLLRPRLDISLVHQAPRIVVQHSRETRQTSLLSRGLVEVVAMLSATSK